MVRSALRVAVKYNVACLRLCSQPYYIDFKILLILREYTIHLYHNYLIMVRYYYIY